MGGGTGPPAPACFHQHSYLQFGEKLIFTGNPADANCPRTHHTTEMAYHICGHAQLGDRKKAQFERIKVLKDVSLPVQR